MGLYKIFKDIFYDTMTSRGFVHQKNVFLRINGEVLQAVTIKPIVAYDVTCAVFPLFAAKDFSHYFRDSDLGKKPYWAEMFTMRFCGYKDFPCLEGGCLRVFMNKEPFLSRTIANLEKAAELMPQMYLDKFDGVYDLDTFLELFTTDDRSWLSIGGHLPPRVLGAKAYYDGNFEYGKRFIENMRAWMKQNKKDISETSRRHIEATYPSVDAYFNEQFEHVDKVISEQYKSFYEYEKENDLSWVPSYVENSTKDTLDILKANYSKLFK